MRITQNTRPCRRWIISPLWVLASGGLLYGQAMIQGGNVLDANPQIGSGGLNPVARTYDFNAANRIVTGNVAGGRAFQGYSPIRDPNELFLGNRAYNPGTLLGSSAYSSRLGTAPGLPSDQLSGFQAGSYSLYDRRPAFGADRAYQALPYYSPQRTVTNVGSILAGTNRPGTPQNPYSVPSGNLYGPAPNPTLSAISGLSGDGSTLMQTPRIIRAESGTAVRGPVNSNLLQSNLFGTAFRELTPVDLARMAQSDPVVARQVPLPPAPSQQPGQPAGQPLDMRAPGYAPADMRLDMRATEGTSPGLPPGITAPPRPEMLPGGQEAGESGAVTTGVFGLMKRMVADRNKTDASPAPPGLRPPAGIGQPPAGSPPPATGDPMPMTGGRQPIVGGQLLRSFVGTEESILNRYLSNAESLLRQGEYYKAATMYRMAQSMDFNNPLPYLGRAVALLAAGDYLTSANDLFIAINMFEQLSDFQVDLKSFLPDVKVIDSRRADLETRLTVADDYRLRFLLGYAEYASGLTAEGLRNMEQAVASAPILLGYMQLPAGAVPPARDPESVIRARQELKRMEAEYMRTRELMKRHERKEMRAEIEKLAEEKKALKDRIGATESAFTGIRMIRLEPVERFVEKLKRQAGPGPAAPILPAGAAPQP